MNIKVAGADGYSQLIVLFKLADDTLETLEPNRNAPGWAGASGPGYSPGWCSSAMLTTFAEPVKIPANLIPANQNASDLAHRRVLDFRRRGGQVN